MVIWMRQIVFSKPTKRDRIAVIAAANGFQVCFDPNGMETLTNIRNMVCLCWDNLRFGYVKVSKHEILKPFS